MKGYLKEHKDYFKEPKEYNKKHRKPKKEPKECKYICYCIDKVSRNKSSALVWQGCNVLMLPAHVPMLR